MERQVAEQRALERFAEEPGVIGEKTAQLMNGPSDMVENSAVRRVGIMGGTFDPIHNGHLAIARSVADQLSLDEVMFIPTGRPNFKRDRKVTSGEDRANMVELAIAGVSDFVLSRCEVERPGITYTADTMRELTTEYPQTHFYFIMGADSAATLVKWKYADQLVNLMSVVATQRPGYDFSHVREIHEASSLKFDMKYVEVPQVDISSTELRAMIAEGRPTDRWICKPVREYIAQHGLYQQG